ncbi:hypothetical protein [Variovorax paradoxus]|uniref:hypothetical protein n=1 Tax=Variovorax paradoxus TaxID=34073 RepID=UPI001D172C79|nr:hypothetical protein [Variovorax paradoxus]
MDASDVSATCIQEASAIASNLLDTFPAKPGDVLRPKFLGCGILGAAEGDIISSGCLYEIKAGARAFRISDIRQLLVYSTLAYASGSLEFDRIGLCNPRTGAFWVKSLDSICQSISGLKASDVLSNLARHFDSLDSYQS